ncbi:DUF1127 domain-containing protein [Rubellimicrobium arenae]|uniref:DUF1127 domain-containing protein n=1 Tax=Rubellimicrobium arenae TaxID=2817372 RepID=UPI001B30C325|nr:DUF1127 domain-containing protein [Rubellimicrobium arenae]
MTALTASQILLSRPEFRSSQLRRLGGLRGLLARRAAAVHAAALRRPAGDLSEHLLRDIGLSRAEIAGLDG